MEAKAKARFVRVTPRKARQVIDEIRGKDVAEALAVLRFTRRKSADIIYKVVASAASNAEHNFEMNKDSLYIAEAFVDGGPVLKRFKARAQGRAYPILKRTSHITVVVKERS
ncbi:50S ribosomal protein L22 [Clostridium sp. 'deep sea']|jgi:large subunit ribosomal protein L22|uniref:50S ribosomal protein L22 n=1 Tax=Clostridium sp. 'deep sea' TaxID=2779445 RepID=UPI0018968FC3|nr:50S ribosomal protein L22 [Clostridium sp. 'deep sea']QOR34583.1 50S ribosomal protein L22 [Clostridium sp. 'deep sea']